MLFGIMRGFLFLGVIYWYTVGVWRLIDDYFQKEFVTYLSTEIKKNEHIKFGSKQKPNDGNNIAINKIINTIHQEDTMQSRNTKNINKGGVTDNINQNKQSMQEICEEDDFLSVTKYKPEHAYIKQEYDHQVQHCLAEPIAGNSKCTLK